MTVTLGRTALPAIDSMTCPAVAIEIAPEITSANAQPISPGDADYQARVAQALAAALLEWRANAARTEAAPAVIPRYQTVLFFILLAASIVMGTVALATARPRPRAPPRRLDTTPTQAPARRPARAGHPLLCQRRRQLPA